MLVQIHWQDPNPLYEPRRTEFVAQGDVEDFDALNKWAGEVIRRRQAECPEGWVPMLCTEASEYFVLADEPQVINKP